MARRLHPVLATLYARAGVAPTLTVEETALLLKVSPGTLYNKLGQGKAPELQARKIYRRWFIPVSAVQAILNGHGA